MTVVSMCDKEFSRLDVVLAVEAGRISIDDAARLMDLQRRQVFRLLPDFVNTERNPKA